MSMLTPLGQGDRRGGWGRALRRVGAVLVVLAMLGGAGYGSWHYLASRTPEPPKVACPPRVTVTPTVTPAAAAKTVKVNVYNATTRSGLASTVAGQLKKRAFKVAAVANDPLTTRKVTAAAEIRHGPRGIAAARTVSAQVSGKVVILRDRRADTSVDLVTGAAWKTLRTPAQAAAVLKAKPKPRLAPRPAGC
jgi:hypothetical protein